MPYAILRFAKRKAGGVSANYCHNERKKNAYKSNPDIDKTRHDQNYHFIKPRYNYRREVRERIEAAGCKTRSNSTVMVETLITASPEFLAALSPKEQREYFNRAFEFIADKIGKHNIISAVVHMDEKTPHMHLSFCPITRDGRLSAKAILGNQAQLSKWQTAYHDHMSSYWPELERGLSSQITKRKHIPVWLFKLGERLDRQYGEIVQALSDVSVFNAKKQSEKALQLLADWLPQAERFTAHMSTIDDHVKSLERAVDETEQRIKQERHNAHRQQNAAVDEVTRSMQYELDEKDRALYEQHQQAKELRRQNANQAKIISRIPPEMRDRIVEQIKPKERKHQR